MLSYVDMSWNFVTAIACNLKQGKRTNHILTTKKRRYLCRNKKKRHVCSYVLRLLMGRAVDFRSGANQEKWTYFLDRSEHLLLNSDYNKNKQTYFQL